MVLEILNARGGAAQGLKSADIRYCTAYPTVTGAAVLPAASVAVSGPYTFAPTVAVVAVPGPEQSAGDNAVVYEPSAACTCTPRFALGENIAKGQKTVKQVMDEWMGSHDHRANIIHGAFDEVGIGIVGDVWVQDFGRVEPQ